MYWGVETPGCPMYRGVETPRCPMYQGVAKLDPLMIQNSPKYRGVETPRCPMNLGVFFCFVFNIQVHVAALATLIQKTVKF